MPYGFTREEFDWFVANRQGCLPVVGRVAATNDRQRPLLVEIECPFCEQIHYHDQLAHGFRRPLCRFEDLPPRVYLSTNDLPDYFVIVTGLSCPMTDELPEETGETKTACRRDRELN